MPNKEQQMYIGLKVINAKPMTRLEYNQFRGWQVPADENPNDDGFLVEYIDGGQPNTKEYKGYVSWSPKAVFEAAYKASGEMSFSHAVEALKLGKKVARAGWNGKGMWLSFVAGNKYDIGRVAMGFKPSSDPLNVKLSPWLGIKTADNAFVPWLASQTDILAEDWAIVE